ncbi:zinc ABC transporter substrate-binding protein [soil metagenome]
MTRSSALLRGVLAIALLAPAACGPVGDGTEPQELRGRRIRAVATTGMVADAVANVGRGRVDVTALMGPGVDPHLYKASEGDVIALADADVVFYSGLHLEAKLAEVFEEMSDQVRTSAITDQIPRSELTSPPAFEGNYDPHVWFDVELWSNVVDEVERTLADLDPASAPLYEDNAAVYRARLERLDRYVARRAASIPADARVLITAHDAFKYFGSAYGFEVRGLQGISTAAETGAADVASLAEFIAERRIPAVFVESSVPERFVQAVQEAVQARGFDVAIGGSLYSDAMGTPGTADGTYVGMVRHNIDTIVHALRPQEANDV